jgi:surfactin synthase thioesterase subunit
LSRHETARSLRRENRRQPADLLFPGDHFYLNSSRAVFLRTFTVDLIRLHSQN